MRYFSVEAQKEIILDQEKLTKTDLEKENFWSNGKDIFNMIKNYEHTCVSEWIQVLPLLLQSTCIGCWLLFPSKVENSLHWWKFLRTPFNLLPNVQISSSCIQSSTLGSLSAIAEEKKLLCRTYHLNFCFQREKQITHLGIYTLLRKIQKCTFLLCDKKASGSCSEDKNEIKKVALHDSKNIYSLIEGCRKNEKILEIAGQENPSKIPRN